MCDKLRGGDMAQKPRSAYDLLMEKHRRDKTVWFLDDLCPRCGKAVYSNGKEEWCSNPFCKKPGTYAGILEDYIR